ncbi:Crp/Fnr family transcriptional regulator [Sphingobacteriaceae bacterium]|nr:Crp/Fnr family transcriptional regulator [Sphingobacteriaceae bacterium]
METLKYALNTLADLNEDDFNLSKEYWQKKEYKKGDYYNEYRHVCKYLGFVEEGVFRTYYVDAKTELEKNVFFFSQHQVVVSFESFIHQSPCNYYTQSMTDSKVLYIHVDHLKKLYAQSHKWERLGRLIAEMAFSISMKRTESFLFQSPEERYLDLIKQHPEIFNNIPLYHLSSYLGIQGPSLSRIRKRISGK